MQTHYNPISMLLVAAMSLCTSPFAGADTGPAGFQVDGTDTLSIPLRWCAVEGSPAVTNPPGGASPANTSAVLLGRMNNATNQSWLPGASIIFISAVPASAGAVNFPIIADPKPPSAGGPGQLGDIQRCTGSATTTNSSGTVTINCEQTAALDACRAAWTALGNAQSITFRGPAVLHVRNLVTSTGAPSSFGTSNWSLWRSGAVCRSNWVINNGNNNEAAYAVVTDNQVNADAVDRTLAHELGHVLFLTHGNGIDDDGDTFADACDGGWPPSTDTNLNPSSPPESTSLSSPASLMVSGANTLSLAITASQKFVARTVGFKISGRAWDPPGVLINDDAASATQVDASGDVTDASADLVAVGITENPADQTTSIALALAGPIPHRGHYQYAAYVDLDNSLHTAGPPPALGFPQSERFTGADLVVSVAVINGTVSTRVWGVRSGRFVRLHDPRIRVHITDSGGQDEESGLRDVQSNGIVVEIPNDVRGLMALTVRSQAYARHTAHHQIDALPDMEGGAPLSLTPSRFAGAFVTPLQARPGEEVTVEAADLVPHGLAQVFLGSTQVGEGEVDSEGNLLFVFTVPEDTVPGVRLVSVRVHTVTAGAALEVLCHSFNGSCYALVPGDQNATTAEQACVDRFGGHLASIHSQAEDDFISTLVDPNGEGGITARIGGVAANGFCSGPFATYAWTDNTAWDYQNWRLSTGEPNCTGAPASTQFWPSTNGSLSGWNDTPEGDPLGNFVCKYQP